jgi:hypothetical protein
MASPSSTAAWYRHDAAALAAVLLQQHKPVTTPEDADALFQRLGGSGPAVAAACHRVCRQRGEGFSLGALFEGIGRWALAALEPDAAEMEALWRPGSGPNARVFTAAECRGIMANVLLLNVQDPMGDLKPPGKGGGLRLDRAMLRCPDVGTQKLACLLHYFAAGLEAEGTDDDVREIRFERRVGESLSQFKQAALASSAGHGPELPVTLHAAAMEAVPEATGFVNFANGVFGYGEFIASCTQEEIIQVCCPEFNVGMFFIPTMADDEIVVVHGCRRFAAYSGYLHTFVCEGRWEGEPAVQSILTMDACTRAHFTEAAVLRDIQKAALAFAGQAVVSTGRWGCGIFGGLPAHKFVQQLVAARLCGSTLHFSTFGQPDQCDEILEGLAAIQVKEVAAAAPSVGGAVDGADDAVRSPTPSPGQLSSGRLLQALLDCCSDAPGAVEAEAARLSAEQREARRLLAQAEAAEAEANPARAAKLYSRAFKLDRELDQSPTSVGWGGASHQHMFVSRFLSAVRGAPYDTEDPYGFI